MMNTETNTLLPGELSRAPHARVGDQLCFAAYAASRALTSHYRTRLADLGLTYPQYLTMLAVWEADGSTVRELGAVLDLDSGTLSPILSRLQSAGFIEKHRASDDERTVHVTSTLLGWRLEERAALVREAVEEATGLSASEMAELRNSLLQLRSQLTLEHHPS